MIKSIVLIKRKGELQTKKKGILREISELCADMERNDLEDFIRTGNSEQQNGHQLELLQRKQKHLISLEGSLNLEIGKLRKKERTSQLQKLEKKAKALEDQRKGTLYQKYLHFQSKIKALREQDKELKEEVLAVKSETFQYKKDSIEIHFKLPELEQVLQANYFQKPEELVELVEKAHQDNEIALHPGPEDMITEVVRGFGIVLNRDSGKIEKITPATSAVTYGPGYRKIVKGRA